MKRFLASCPLSVICLTAACWGGEPAALRAQWDMPPSCTPFAPVRIQDLKEELRQTGYRLAIAIHPDKPAGKDGQYPPRDLHLIHADGTGLKPIANTPDKDERVPRTSPDGKLFTYNYGDFLVDAKTLTTRQLNGGYVWTPDSQRTAECGKRGIVYTDVRTGTRGEPIPVPRRVSITDLSFDGRWFIFEIRDYLGCRYTIDFLSSAGGDIRKMPNHPARQGKDPMGECHPAFSPDGKWMCWNAGGGLGVRKFDPSLPEGTGGEIVTLPESLVGQDPCGRWSHCGRYIAFVKIPAAGSWRVHSPLCIVRLADKAAITVSPPGWVGHHWDYDWLPPDDEAR